MSKIPTNRSISTPAKVVFRQRRISADSKTPRTSVSEPSNNPFRLADRVTTGGKSGTVAFVGRTQFAEGEWIGIILDEPQGKNDGSYNGVHYFETEPNRGLFCRPDKAQHLPQNGASQRASMYNPSRLSVIEDQVNTSSGNAAGSSLDPASIKHLQIGDRVVIRGTKYGIIKYIGRIHINEGIWCGIKLDGPLGKHNGKIEGVRYFRCQHRFGIFAPLRHVEKLIVETAHSRASAEQSANPRHSHIRFRDSSSPDSNLSECSSSTNSLNHFPTRSPSQSRTSNPMADPSGREKALSSEITNLMDRIREKDKYIEQLQQQNSNDRRELSRTTEKMNEMDINILALQQESTMKDNENELLHKQQQALTERIEDLQFQLEEYQYLESDHDHPTIPDDHLLLSPKEIDTYEKTKAKLAELQSTNGHLSYQNQVFQEQIARHHELVEKEKQTNKFIEELKKQIELLKSQVTDLQMKEQSKTAQLASSEASYKQQVKEYQLQIEQMTREAQNVHLRVATLEQDKNTNDRRLNDLINELKDYQERIVPQLEKQCQTLKTELQNRERTENTTANERERHYEEQIKKYQDAINQATRETDQVRAELTLVREEHQLKEQTTDALINDLKSNYAEVQTELTELNEREHQTSLARDQRESFFEQQMLEYEHNLNQATRQTESIQAELAKLDQDKILHEQKSNSTVNSLKQEYESQFEVLKSELVELQEKDRTQNIVLNERIAHYEIEMKEYQIKRDQDASEIEDLRNELVRVREEKSVQEKELNRIIDALKHDLNKLQNQLNDREHQTNESLANYESQYKEQIEEYRSNLQQSNEQMKDLQSQFDSLHKEKRANEEQLTVTIERLMSDLQALTTDLQDRDQTQTTTANEREVHYQTQIQEHQAQHDQLLGQIQELKAKVIALDGEKATNESQSNETINALKHEYEATRQELRTELDELNERERKAHKDLHQREAQFDQQITEYQDKLEQAHSKWEHLHTEWNKLHAEKLESDEIIAALQRDLATVKTELRSQDDTRNMALNEREVHYETQIKTHQAEQEQSLLQVQSLQAELAKLQQEKATTESGLNRSVAALQQDCEQLRSELAERERQEKKVLKQREQDYEQQLDEYQKNLELAIVQYQTAQSELTHLHEAKASNEKQLNSMMQSVKEELEQQVEVVQTQNTELLKRQDAIDQALTQKDQELHEYQTKFNQLKEETLDLNEQNETKLSQIEQLKEELEQKQQISQEMTTLKEQHEQTREELVQRAESLTATNEALMQEIEQLKNRTEQPSKSATSDHTADQQAVIDQLTSQLNSLQQMHNDVLEKQAAADQKSVEERKVQEQAQKEKIGEYQMQVALMKSEHMVELENIKLEHDQAILYWKNQLQQATTPATKSKGKK